MHTIFSNHLQDIASSFASHLRAAGHDLPSFHSGVTRYKTWLTTTSFCMFEYGVYTYY